MWGLYSNRFLSTSARSELLTECWTRWQWLQFWFSFSVWFTSIYSKVTTTMNAIQRCELRFVSKYSLIYSVNLQVTRINREIMKVLAKWVKQILSLWWIGAWMWSDCLTRIRHFWQMQKRVFEHNFPLPHTIVHQLNVTVSLVPDTLERPRKLYCQLKTQHRHRLTQVNAALIEKKC